ncbi:MAG: biotin/lipoyl-binding protein, partial [Paraprevotella sp.]|nr:biotin/lipoyl-binding protein [Paraprevotella sp.]
MKEYKFKISGQDYAASVEELENGALNVTVNGKTFQVELPEKAHHPATGIVRPAASAPAAQGATTVARPASAAPGNVIAPLPGTITSVKVQAGQKVKKGDVLVVMEAMKMAN